LDALGFARRELGQDVPLSEVISVIQAVPGVEYLDVDTLGGIPERRTDAGVRRLLTPDEITQAVRDAVTGSQLNGRPEHRVRCRPARFSAGLLLPAQLAFAVPELPETLILNQIE
ncbi:MAG: putative baseplate assembly protein, partial [Pseudomonadota bacterium]